VRNKVIAVISVMFLAACETTAPVIRTEIQRVEVPIPIPCQREIPTRPDFSFEQLSVQDPLIDKAKSILSDRQLHLAYEELLVATLEACKQLPESAQ